MQEPDPRLLHDIKDAEGCRLAAYKDTLGYWTIGWGHLLPAGTNWSGYTWSQDRADAVLSHDVEIAIEYAQRLLEWPSLNTDARRNALSELCFNMGSKWLGFHNTRAALYRGDWNAAAAGLLDSVWATQVGPTRSGRIAGYIRSGGYPCSTN